MVLHRTCSVGPMLDHAEVLLTEGTTAFMRRATSTWDHLIYVPLGSRKLWNSRLCNPYQFCSILHQSYPWVISWLLNPYTLGRKSPLCGGHYEGTWNAGTQCESCLRPLLRFCQLLPTTNRVNDPCITARHGKKPTIALIVRILCILYSGCCQCVDKPEQWVRHHWVMALW